MGLIYPSTQLARADILGYGMPHIGCTYTRDDVAATAFDDDWVACAICGATATNRHHEPPRGRHSATDDSGRKRLGALLLMTERGRFVLKPALIALCGSGTTGCHSLVHSRLVEIEWAFDTEEYAGQWESGYLLSHGIKPHSEKLYGYGCWHFHDKRNGKRWEHRGGGY